ncbi:MAG: glycosyltransferase [Burkholderiales bacterium]
MVARKVLRYALLASLIAAIAVLATMAFWNIVQSSGFSIAPLLQSFILTAIGGYLMLFLLVISLRYAGLIFFSLSEHFTRLTTTDDSYVSTQVDLSSLPMVTIVVPAYNEGLVIQAALRSLLQLEYINYEIIVVDDGSSDDTYEQALAVARESRRIPIRVVTQRNGGKADALNTGASHARGELILNMDGDTKLAVDSLRHAVKHFEDPNIGAVAGNVKVLNRENLLTKLQALEYVEGLAMARTAQSFIRMVSIVPGPLGLFRRSVLAEAGGYDSDTYAEDCDLTIKILLNGWRIGYEDKSVAYVESPNKLLDLLQQRYRWTRGMLQALRKRSSALWHPRRSLTNFLLMWYMVFEVIIWPFSTVLGNVFFLYVGLKYGLATLLLFWWLQLTLLDIVSAMYCIFLEDEDLSLLLYVVLFRLFYMVVVDFSKLFAVVEEFMGIGMTWGKLKRVGRL